MAFPVLCDLTVWDFELNVLTNTNPEKTGNFNIFINIWTESTLA